MTRPMHTTRPVRFAWMPIAGFAVFCLIGVFVTTAAAATPTQPRIQELMGETIVAITRHDQEMLATLQEVITQLMRRSARFELSQSGRIQQNMGQAVIDRAQAIRMQQLSLRSRMAIATRDINLLFEDSPAGRQTQLGWAVRTAALRAPQGGEAFQVALGKEITRLEQVRLRTISRLVGEWNLLKMQEADLLRSAPQQFQEAMESARRSVEMADNSMLEPINEQIEMLTGHLMQRQSPLLYAQMAKLAQDRNTGQTGVGGFVEYGLAAMAGAVAVMVWFGLIATKRESPKDQVIPTHRLGLSH